MPGEATSRATRRRACSTGSSGITWMTSCARRADGAGLPEFIAREFREFLA